jgi:putative transposase
MARPYSNDLRERVVRAVERDGLSRNQAAAQFGVAISTAIGWVERFRRTGSVAPGQMGGHKPRTISGEHHDWLLARCRAGAFTLRGLVAELATERGLKVDYRSVWAFVHAEGLSYKKKRSGQRAGPARHRAPPGAVAPLSAADRPGAAGVHR